MPPVDERAADGNAAQAGEHEEVHECLPGGWDARGVEASAELVATQRTFSTQGALDQRDAALRVGCRDTGLSKPARVGGEQRWRSQGMEPPVVLAPDQVERAAIQPADHERAVVQPAVDVSDRQAARARPNRQAGAAKVLCLDGEQALADLDGIGTPLFTEELSLEPRRNDIGAHAAALPTAVVSSAPFTPPQHIAGRAGRPDERGSVETQDRARHVVNLDVDASCSEAQLVNL